MSASRDRSVGRLFNTSADLYATARPGYPSRVYELLKVECGLGPGSRVLEIGAGAGQATRELLAMGACVTAVEPGAAFIEHLRALGGAPEFQLVVATFEEADLQPSHFDLVVSATAFHWVDPDVGIPKVATALTNGGALAIWATLYGDPDRPDHPFHEALQPILEQHAPELIPPPSALAASAPRGTSEWISVLESSRQFEPVRSEIIRWAGHHDARGIRLLFSTFSPWMALPSERRDLILNHVEMLAREQFSNQVVRPYRTVIHWTRRVHRSGRVAPRTA